MGSIYTYKESLTQGSDILANKGYIFIGQGTVQGGHGMCPTLEKVPNEQRIELPVFEETQTGIALGMAMSGLKIVSVYPRFDFFISGMNQFVNHADKLKEMSDGQYNIDLIFRVGVGAKVPLDAGPQHTNNYSEPFKEICSSTNIVEIKRGNNPLDIYKDMSRGGLWLAIEHYEFYGEMACGA